MNNGNEHKSEADHYYGIEEGGWQKPDSNDHKSEADHYGIEEGGWQKPVAPPKADRPPVDMTQAFSSPKSSTNANSREKSSDG